MRSTEEAVLGSQYYPSMGRGKYDGQGMYWGLSTASEVFLIYYPTFLMYLCYNALYAHVKVNIVTRILPTPNTPLSLLLVGSKLLIHCTLCDVEREVILSRGNQFN